jgi:hypothetical protein
MRFLRLMICGWLCLALAGAAAFAQGNGNGKGKGKNKHAQQENAAASDRGARIVFSVQDRDIIREYYRNRYANLPPGLAKRGGNLPPGLKKHLERDGTLPPGLQKRVEPFPVELERRLAPLPSTCSRVTLGVDILILDRRTQRILDIVHDILRP